MQIVTSCRKLRVACHPFGPVLQEDYGTGLWAWTCSARSDQPFEAVKLPAPGLRRYVQIRERSEPVKHTRGQVIQRSFTQSSTKMGKYGALSPRIRKVRFRDPTHR